MKKNILYLHIGTQKTGTSSLQEFLYLNNNLLMQKNFCYPDLVSELGVQVDADQRYKNGCCFGPLMYRDKNIEIVSNEDDFELNESKGKRPNTSSEEWKHTWSTIRKYLDNYNVIISEESVWGWNTSEFIAAAKREYHNVKVILYLRRQDKFAESYWNQGIKRYCNLTASFDDYVKVPTLLHLIDYKGKIQHIEKTIGKDNVIVRVYEKNQFLGNGNSIFDDFVNAIDIGINMDECTIPHYSNERLSPNFLEIKRLMNKGATIDDWPSRQIEMKFLEYAQLISDNNITKETAYFDKRERINFIEKYEEDNVFIAKRYLGKRNGVLFEEEIGENERVKVIYDDEFISNLVEIITSILIQMQRQITHSINYCEFLDGERIKRG